MYDSDSCLGKAASCATIIGALVAIISAVIAAFTYFDYNPFISNKSNLQGNGLTPHVSSHLPDSLLFTVENVSFKMIRVEEGTFMMGAREGDNDAYEHEKPAHQVTLSSYYIGETEVTQALWEAVMNYNPSSFNGSNLPVESVSWNDCQNFIEKLNAVTKKKFRLPTEAEWEYAARGGKKSKGFKYSGSYILDEVAWYFDNSDETHEVATKKANELGLYDMSGNVWEWCSDIFEPYSNTSLTNPQGSKNGRDRIYRGGSWSNSAGRSRVSNRTYHSPEDIYPSLGFRLALSE